MWLYVSSFRLCVCVCVYLSGRDYIMECAAGCVELYEQVYFSRNLQHIPRHSLDQIGTHTHSHRRNELTYSHIPTLFITNVNQHSNSVT